MKWKSALTAEEAALLSTGLQVYRTLDALPYPAPLPPGCHDEEKEQRNTQIKTANEIYEALLQEIYLADPYEESATEGVTSPLAIAMRVQQSEHDNYIAPEKCTVTKLSLAKWFWQHDQEMAKKFWPSITDEIVHPPQPIRQPSEAKTQNSTKGYNSRNKIIAALSDALIDGKTGQHNKDAETVLAALASKGVKAPIGQKALSDYLKAAYELDS